MSIYNSDVKEKEEVLFDEQVNQEKNLILHNDDIHTFDYVIDTLIEVCNHDQLQAEQCTYIVHYKGKCDVKSGCFDDLKPLKDELNRRELEATIE